MIENLPNQSPKSIQHQNYIKSRNMELAVGISKYAEKYHMPGNSKERDRNILETIRGWAIEIVFNCDAELDLMK
ncbi:MAG: hypothetical protein HDR71_15455 [Lachnospiraceae bacterium]|nr:hypothetical protein [Lachnospiraceae bacterium]